MNTAFRRFTILLAFGAAFAYGYVALRGPGPNSIPGVIQKRGQVKVLQEKNADLVREIERKRKRIRDLETNSAVQHTEIRKQLRLQQPGETTFVLPDRPKPETAQPIETPTP
jgi:cell division protein FtsB